ncbi:competence protein ComK [Fredinandcohnia sp. 179-A 10B2 NHS]|uniref:competence protein ComK n=1 Tax=Fredinandcohnia sp. 179-A 10B2 NHS TaxID=3235176 RepID=UPI0039A38731
MRLFNFSTFITREGRQEGTKEIMGITHKAPIIVEASNKIYLFPTTSPSKPQCAWLSHTYILDSTYEENEQTTVIFTNKQSIQLQISKGSFKNQLHRTAQLRTIVASRMEKQETKRSFVLNPPTHKESHTKIFPESNTAG